MLKKILITDLAIGMHIHELCGSWMDHPFWRRSFLLSDPQDLKLIRSSALSECWIDTKKGLDAPSHHEALADEASQAKEEERAFLRDAPRSEPEIAEPEPPENSQEIACSFAEELARAKKLCASSGAAVRAMFGEARMGKALSAQAASSVVEQISRSAERHPLALLSIARLKAIDDYTYMHSVAVCALMLALARELGLGAQETRDAGLAGLLHDVGKAKIPEAILNKPGALSEEEFKVMKSHPMAGHRLLSQGGLGHMPAAEACLRHHEKMDGTGYPNGIKAQGLSVITRMSSICDVYDAITSERVYKKGWSPGEALRKMATWKGHFDPTLFQAFVKTIGIYPIGTLVRLRSQRLGVVIDRGPDLLHPIVKVFYSEALRARISPIPCDLLAEGDAVISIEDAAAWGFEGLDSLWGA